jgi:RimJ/RimL family protein N-acetyltransferase
MARAFLIGPRVRLRAMEESDAEQLAEWINHPDMREFLLVRFPMSLRDEKEWIAGHSVLKGTPHDLAFAIELVKEGRLIGATGLHLIDWVQRRAMTGMFLFPEEVRGKGYGTEAKNLLLDYAFGELGLHSIFSFTFGENRRSQQALERQGYRRGGVHRKAYLVKGEWVDGIYFDILREEWEELRKARRARPSRKPPAAEKSPAAKRQLGRGSGGRRPRDEGAAPATARGKKR